MSNNKRKVERKNLSLKNINRLFFRMQLLLIITLALILGISGTMINIQYERQKRDQNLQNVAETIAQSPILTDGLLSGESRVLSEYLDTLKDSLDDIDVISVVDDRGVRVYHTNSALVGTKYDGNMPDFNSQNEGFYAVNENGPSGSQRRAYAAIYNKDGEYVGVVMAIMLMKNINTEIMQMLLTFGVITLAAVAVEIFLASKMSRKMKNSLMGYEPDVFTAMYKMRDNILETLKEGILAIDNNGIIAHHIN